jgi:hypothetical protein
MYSNLDHYAGRIAENMIHKYGADRAYEYVSRYTSGIHFEPTPEGRVYWSAVAAEIRNIDKAVR